MSDRVEATELALRRHFEAGDHEAVATLALREYGPEILGVLAARLGGVQDAREVFSDFCEDLWRGLGGFRWQCSLRVWAYTLARHAALRYVRRVKRRDRAQLPLSQVGAEVARVAEAVRSTTVAHLRTDVKGQMRELREALPPEDQELLILRVDKGMSFRDLAVVLSEPGAQDDAQSLERSAARLRKRFQLAKDKLRDLAEKEGLI